MIRLLVVKSSNKNKKYDAIFTDGTKEKKISFGAAHMNDYTITGDKKARERYIKRHEKNEDWNNPFTRGALSYYILWGDSNDINKNIRAFKNRFNFY
jgi:hypothetical protein